jgi:hypothetical protein
LSLVSSSTKGGTNEYAAAMEAVTASIAFQQSPSSPAPFASQLKELCKSPLATLLVGYFHRWLLSDDDATQQVSNLVPIAGAYKAAGLVRLAAEAAGLAGQSTLKSAAAQAEKHREIHARLGTASTPAAQRKQRVEAFQSGDGDVFLISLKAGGLGLNLTAADSDAEVRIDGDSQETMNREIAYAAEAGLNYWTFVDYWEDPALTIALRRYRDATDKRGCDSASSRKAGGWIAIGRTIGRGWSVSFGTRTT